MPRTLSAACLQTRPMPDFASATEEALGLSRRAVAAGARLLLLPEYCGGLVTEGAAIHAPAAEEDAHPVVCALRSFAAAERVWILVGSVAVPGPDGRILNRGLTIADDGRIVARYDKIHMFDIQLSAAETYRESARVAPGAAACLVETPWGPVGHTICYDLRFPQLYRDLAQAGAGILTCPAAFTAKTGAVHWHVLNRARAIECGAWMLSPCATGPVPGGGAAYGHSLIVDPWGTVVADAGEGPGIALAEIDLDAPAAARGRIPSLSHDRPYRRPPSATGDEVAAQ